jgi:hypothetical protein
MVGVLCYLLLGFHGRLIHQLIVLSLLGRTAQSGGIQYNRFHRIRGWWSGGHVILVGGHVILVGGHKDLLHVSVLLK